MRIFITIVFIIICITGYSQTQVGGKIGVLKSRFIPKSDSLDGAFTGYSIGVFGDFKINDWLYISPEILMINRGNNINGYIPAVYKDTTIIIQEYKGRISKTIHYIEIPLQVKVKRKSVYVSSGVSFGFKYLERQRIRIRENELKFVKQEEISDIDINIISSIGCQYQDYIIELRNMYSLSSGYGKSVSVGLNLGLKF